MYRKTYNNSNWNEKNAELPNDYLPTARITPMNEKTPNHTVKLLIKAGSQIEARSPIEAEPGL